MYLSGGLVPVLNPASIPLPTPSKAVTTANAPGVFSCGASEQSVVTKVIDGDTVVVNGGYHVRLLGIDADEKNYPCYQAAKKELEDLVLGKEVVLQKDVTDTDQYGRCLRTIWSDGENVSERLVADGLAVARFYPPDVQYRQAISSAERSAITNAVGCKWKKVAP